MDWILARRLQTDLQSAITLIRRNVRIGMCEFSGRKRSVLRWLALLWVMFWSAGSYAEEGEPGSVTANKLVIESMRCEGNEATECSFITKKYYQKIGDVLDPEEVADARLRISALEQFRDVSIFLDKGSDRGYVVVVFSVKEVSNIRFGLATRYSSSEATNEDCVDVAGSDVCLLLNRVIDSYALEGSVTNFNFLGTGSSLSLGVSKGYDVGEFDLSYSSADPVFATSLPADYFQEAKSNTSSVLLIYDDPYLSGSPRYYLGLAIGYTESRQDIHTNTVGDVFSGDRKYSTYSGDLTLGYRFGRFSYASAIVSYSKRKSYFGGDFPVSEFTSDSHYFEYGWDSRDDKLLPSEGSVFASAYNPKSAALSASYSHNFAVEAGRILNFGISGNKDIDGSNESWGYSVSADYTLLSSIDRYDGAFSGLRVGGSGGERGSGAQHYSLSLSYIRQSDDLVYIFDLSLTDSHTSGLGL